MTTPPKDVNHYIAGFPADVRSKLQQVRRTIRAAAPKAKETISYGMPAYGLDGMGVIAFAGYKNHIGLYPAPTGSAAFNKRLARYKAAKSTVRFPLDEPIPTGLLKQIVRLCIKDNRKRARERAKKPRK